jgi:Fic family protein
MRGDRTVELFPRQYQSDGSPVSHIRFALRYEPLDLAVLVSALRQIGGEEIRRWVEREPTGAYSRRAWFFYENFTGERLELPDATAGNYVAALDPEKHITASRVNSTRHRVIDNLLGGSKLCPTVRKTPRLVEYMSSGIAEKARELTQSYDQLTLARAVNYLFTKETRSSFALENETPSVSRADRFVDALKGAPNFDPTSKRALIGLQGDIVDERYAAKDWRDFQNFVGETVGGYREKVHFICPKPGDVSDLMEGWMGLVRRLHDPAVDPVVAATLVAFTFVFIHPFEDGNGRIHRFLIHHILAQREFSPPGIIFPVSAAILRERHTYDRALETFSQPLLEFIEWNFNSEQDVVVTNETEQLYRYFDATHLVEYLYGRVEDTVENDLKEELGFMAIYDRAMAALKNMIDMPDRRASLLVRLSMQNGGRLSKAKRERFTELTDAEIAAIEGVIRQIIAEEQAGGNSGLIADADDGVAG